VFFPQALAPGYRIAEHQKIELLVIGARLRTLRINGKRGDEDACREGDEEKTLSRF
jgi:hypothetical protein